MNDEQRLLAEGWQRATVVHMVTLPSETDDDENWWREPGGGGYVFTEADALARLLRETEQKKH